MRTLAVSMSSPHDAAADTKDTKLASGQDTEALQARRPEAFTTTRARPDRAGGARAGWSGGDEPAVLEAKDAVAHGGEARVVSRDE